MKLPDHIYKKIKKLFNLAKGAEKIGSLAEAENAIKKLNFEPEIKVHNVG